MMANLHTTDIMRVRTLEIRGVKSYTIQPMKIANMLIDRAKLLGAAPVPLSYFVSDANSLEPVSYTHLTLPTKA